MTPQQRSLIARREVVTMSEMPGQGPTSGQSPADRVRHIERTVNKALRILAELDDVKPHDMTDLFYVNAYAQVDSVLRDLLRALGADPGR
jgi:hypothetical protein